MIIDERTYTIRPGRLRAYLERHFAEALPIMRRYLGEPYGYFTSETGPQPQFVHLWRYEDGADRERRRAALYADPAWLAYRDRTGDSGDVVLQENRILAALPIPQPG
ncbi:MAG: NIPSNAP family protein [Acetobacteraceae bacterium]|nr:NIPSNAP family protein [Acetobacteraceae bacterium]